MTPVNYAWPLELRDLIEEVVTSWPDVRARQVFGHRGFVRAGKMFAFFAEQGLSVRTYSAAEADAFYTRDGVVPFVYNGSMEMRAWPVLPITSNEDAEAAILAAHDAYEGAPV